jgi:hypothetical protein
VEGDDGGRSVCGWGKPWDRVEKPLGESGSGDRGQTGLTANFRQTAPEIHVSLVSPRMGTLPDHQFFMKSRAPKAAAFTEMIHRLFIRRILY